MSADLNSLLDVLADLVAERVAARLAPQAPPPQEVWLKADEAAAYLKLSAQRLEALRRTGRGPQFSRVGRRVRYERASLDAWLGARKPKRGST